jgi:hypothetical protein
MEQAQAALEGWHLPMPASQLGAFIGELRRVAGVPPAAAAAGKLQVPADKGMVAPGVLSPGMYVGMWLCCGVVYVTAGGTRGWWCLASCHQVGYVGMVVEYGCDYVVGLTVDCACKALCQLAGYSS